MKASSKGDRNAGFREIANMVRDTLNQARSDAQAEMDITLNGTVNIDDSQIKDLNRELKDANKNMDALQKKARKGVKLKTDNDINKEISKASKRVKIEPSNQDIYNTDTIQRRIEFLHSELAKIDKKVHSEQYDRITDKQATNYARNYMEYKMYADEFGFLIKDSFKDIFNELEKYMVHETDHLEDVFDKSYNPRYKGDRTVKDGGYYTVEDRRTGKPKKVKREVGSVYADAEQNFMKYLNIGERKAITTIRTKQKTQSTSYTTKAGVTHSTTNTEGQTTSSGQQSFKDTPEKISEVGAAARSAKKDVEELGQSLDDADDSNIGERMKINAKEALSSYRQLKKASSALMQQISDKLTDGFSLEGDEGYFEKEKEEIEQFKTKAKELREQLGNIDINTPVGEYLNKMASGRDYENGLNGIRNVLDNIDQLIPMIVNGYESAYEEVSSNIEHIQQETAERIRVNTEKVWGDITSHQDFKQYGDESWLEDIKQKLQEDGADLQQITDEYISQIEHNKKVQEAALKKVQKVKDLRTFLLDNYTGKDKSGNAKKAYLDQYKEFFDALDESDADEQIEKIKQKWADEQKKKKRKTKSKKQNEQPQEELIDGGEARSEFYVQASQFAKKMNSELGLTRTTVSDLTDEIEQMMIALSKGEDIDISNIRDILVKDKKLMEEVDPTKQAYQIRSFLKGQKIRNLPDYKSEFGDDWNDARKLLGFNVISNKTGEDLMMVLSQMNEAIGTTFNLDTSNAEAMVQLIDAIRGGVTDASTFVDYLEEIGQIDYSKIANQLIDIVDTIHPGSVKTRQMRSPSVSKPTSDDDILSIDDVEYNEFLEDMFGEKDSKKSKKDISDAVSDFVDNTSLDSKEKISTVKEIIKLIQKQKDLDDEYDRIEKELEDIDDDAREDALNDRLQDIGIKSEGFEKDIEAFIDEYQALKIVLKDGSEIIADGTNFKDVLYGLDPKQIKEAYLQYTEFNKAMKDFDDIIGRLEDSHMPSYDSMLDDLLDSNPTKEKLKEMYKMTDQEAQDLFDKIQYVNQNLFKENGDMDLTSDAVDVYNEIADIIQRRYDEMATSVVESFNRMNEVATREGRDLLNYYDNDPKHDVDDYTKNIGRTPYYLKRGNIADKENVGYHAGKISRLNKAETLGISGPDRGTGWFGTGHYFVDYAHKNELDKGGAYSKKPYTSIDLSYYDNLFKANTDSVASKLHRFLKDISKYAFGKDTDEEELSDLYNVFQSLFNQENIDKQNFYGILDGLKDYASTRISGDLRDSVSTKFMKDFGYGGVDTRGTNYANTYGGIVIYDLKEESILQANITDELEKQGDMLEKRNYEAGEVWDKDEDKRIQGLLDEQKKRREIQEEYRKIYDAENGQKIVQEYDDAVSRIDEINNIIARCESRLENAEEEAKEFLESMLEFDLFDEDDITPEKISKQADDIRKSMRDDIDELEEERQEIESKLPNLKEQADKEREASNKAFEQAKRNVEARYQQTPKEPQIDLNKLDSQISDIEAKTKKMVEDVSLMFAQPISGDQNEEYYTTLLSQIEAITPAAKELQDQLNSLTIPETATNLTNRASGLGNQFAFIDQMINQQKDRIHQVYDGIDFEAQKAQKELEEKISQRQHDIINRINSNADFKKYGEATWLQDYMEKVRDDTKSVDEIYEEFETQLAERKASVLAQEEKDEKQRGNRGKFLEYLKGISPSGEQEYGENLIKYSDILNSITDDAKTLEDAIARVDEQIKDTNQQDTGKKQKTDIEQLIDEYNRLYDIIDKINQKQSPTPSEKGQRTKARNQRDIVEKQLQDRGMYKKFDGEKVTWVEDKFNLKQQYQDMLDLISSGDFEKIKDNLQDVFNVDIDSMDDVEKLKTNIEELIAVLDKANIDASMLKLSDMDQFGLNDLMDPRLVASTLSSHFNVSEDLLNEFRKKFESEAEANAPDTSGTKEQTEAEHEQADAARDAADAEKERKEATEDANNVPPPNNPPGDNGSKNPPPGGGSGGGGNNPPPGNSGKPKKNPNIIGTTYRDDGTWERRYSNTDGRVLAVGQRLKYDKLTKQYVPERYEKEVTNFNKLEQDAIRVNNQLIDAWAALSAAQMQGYGNTEFTAKLKERIDLLLTEKEELEDIADLYDAGPDYDGSKSQYSRAKFDERVNKKVNEHRSEVEVKSAKQLIKDEEQKQRAIERTNSFIVEQEGKIARLQEKYIDKNPIKLPQADLDKLNELRYGVGGDENNITGGIQGWLNKNRANGGRATTQSEREVLNQMIKDYEQTAKISTESQKIATKLAARSPEEARAALSKDLNSLLRDIKASKADVTNVKIELEQIIADFQREQNNYLNGQPSQINSKDFLKQIHARTNVAKSNFQDIEDEYKTNQKQLQEYINIIQEAEDARSNVNRIKADKISGKAIVDETEALEELRVKAQAAGNAIYAIFRMVSEGKIDMAQAIDARNMYNLSREGSAQSREQILRAKNNQNASKVKTQLTEYANASMEYSQLFTKSLSGKLTTQETKRMSELLQTIVQTEKQWNNAKAVGVQLSQKQEDALNQINDAKNARSKGDKNYTQKLLEENALEEKALQARNKLANRLSKMMEQSGWRSDSDKWIASVKSLQDDLDNISINVKNKDDLDKVLKQIDEIGARRQKLSKETAMQPIGQDWQSKQLNSMAKWMDQNKKAARAFADELRELQEEIKEVGSKGGAEEWNTKWQDLQTRAANQGLLGKSLGDRFKDQFKNTMTSLATYYLSFQDFIRYGREAISIITELDTQLTEMRKVSNESLQTLQQYQLETFDIASRVGTTASQIQASTADWLRLGENLEQAKKSAEYSTMLLNVSEFESIDAATESLVAMSQAYKDLDKIEIIDKLNNIGNNFSISTSDLAKSLQKSVGALTTTGDSIDEAIALTVAGNQVLQAPDIVGQSLKTISLRLSGTSVEDMQEAGEEVDGLISTTSKLRKTIMDITKVQKNGYQGFDILDENGNYKTTYERLKGIAEVWHEIGEEDKKMGTNRQSLLLETIAGKTRAAAASSILENFDTLKDVYEASLDSQGSAQQELDKYLDSIKGKTAQFQNELQKLASSAIDSSAIKSFIDLGTQLLKILDQLGGAFGHLNTVIGAAAGIFLQVNGKGLFGFDKNTKQFTNNIPKIADGVKNGFIKVFGQKQFGSDILKSAFSGLSSDTAIMDVLKNTQGNDAKLAIAKALGSWWSDMDHGERASATIGNALDGVGQSVLSLTGAFSKLASVGLDALSTLGTMALVMAATWAAGTIIKGIYNIIHAEEILIEKGKAARQAISDINSGYTEKDDYIDKNLDKYLKLREGTRTTKNGGIQNVSLANDEYDEFIQINQELAQLFPSLVTTYDAQGHAILTLSSDADKATASLSELLEQERQLADFKVGEQLGDAVTGFATRYGQLSKDIEKLDKVIGSTQTMQDLIDDRIDSDQIDTSKFGLDEYGILKWEYDPNDENIQRLVDKISSLYVEAADSIYKNVSFQGSDSTAGLLIANLVEATEEDVEKFELAFKAALEQANLSGIPGDIIDAISTKNIDLAEIKADWNGLVPSILSQLNLYGEYQKLGDSKLGEQLQNILSDDISNMHFEGFTKEDWKLFGDSPRQFIRERFLDPIINTISDEKGNYSEAIMKEMLDVVNQKDISYKDWVTQIRDKSMQWADGDYELSQRIRVALGVTYVDENNKEYYDDADSLANLAEITGLSTNDLADLKLEDLELAFNASVTGNLDFKGATIEEFVEWIDKYKKAQQEAKEIKEEGTLSSIFNDESYQAEAEKYEKHLSSLTGALSTLREEGTLTAEAIKNLQEEFPDMTEFSEEAIGDAALKELSGWIDALKKDIDTLSPKGMEQLLTYANNLNMSFGDLGVSAQEAKQAVQDSMVDIYASYGKQQGQSAQATNAFNDLVQQIEDSGQEVNWQIVWELGMMDRFSDPAANIYEEYNNLEMIWKIKVDADQAINDIQREIDKRNKEISKLEAENNLKEASGYYLDEGDYVDIWRKQNKNYEDSKRQTEVRQNAIDTANQIKDSALGFLITDKYMDTLEGDLLDAQTEEINSRIEMLNTIKTQAEAGANKYTSALTKAQNDTKKRQNEIDRMINDGMVVNQKFYDSLADGYDEQAKENEMLRLYWQNQADKATTPELKNEFQGKANDYDNAVIQANESALQARSHMLEEYSGELTEIQSKATRYQQTITDAEARHKKVSEKTYSSLIKNGNKQITNLQKQKKELQNLQTQVSRGSEKWRDYQSQIDSIDSSIAAMANDQIGWFEQMTSLISTNASALSSAIQSAFSEINSETGLTIETMEELKKQFSDIEGFDIANIFYQSADGMKFNADAAEYLVDAEYQVEQASLREIIATNEKIAADQTATASAREQANARIEAAQRELSMLQALYDQQKQQFTRFSAWQTAQSTENAGANYEALQGFLETQTKAFDQSMTGTDEFKAYTKYFDQWGADTVGAWKRNSEKIKRYLTEDFQGIKNFYDDLVKNGFGTEENGLYDVSIPNVEEAAKTMGMSVEWFRDMMSRGEDYGFTNNWVESTLDGEMKIREETQKLIDEQIRLNRLREEGADANLIREAEQNVNVYKDNIDKLIQNTESVGQREGKITASELRNQIETINSLRRSMRQAETDWEKDEYAKRIQSLADEYQIPLKGELEIDKDGLEEKYPGYKTDIKVNLTADHDFNEDLIQDQKGFEEGQQQLIDGFDATDKVLKEAFAEINKLSPEEFENIVTNNNKWDKGFEKAEHALATIAEKTGVAKENIKDIIPIIESLGLYGEGWEQFFNEEKTFDVTPKIKSFETTTGTEITNLKEVFKEDSIPISLDFDIENASTEELDTYILNLKGQLEKWSESGAYTGTAAFAQLDKLITSLEQEHEFKLRLEEIDSAGLSLDELMSMTYEGFMAKGTVDMDETEFEELKQRVASETIEAQIRAKVEGGETTIEALQALSGEELKNKLEELHIEVTGIEDLKVLEQIVDKAAQTPTITVTIDETQFGELRTLLGGQTEEGIDVPLNPVTTELRQRIEETLAEPFDITIEASDVNTQNAEAGGESHDITVTLEDEQGVAELLNTIKTSVEELNNYETITITVDCPDEEVRAKLAAIFGDTTALDTESQEPIVFTIGAEPDESYSNVETAKSDADEIDGKQPTVHVFYDGQEFDVGYNALMAIINGFEETGKITSKGEYVDEGLESGIQGASDKASAYNQQYSSLKTKGKYIDDGLEGGIQGAEGKAQDYKDNYSEIETKGKYTDDGLDDGVSHVKEQAEEIEKLNPVMAVTEKVSEDSNIMGDVTQHIESAQKYADEHPIKMSYLAEDAETPEVEAPEHSEQQQPLMTSRRRSGSNGWNEQQLPNETAVTVTADTTQYTSDVEEVKAETAENPATLTVEGEKQPAIDSGTEAKTEIDKMKATITIDGDHSLAVAKGRVAVGLIEANPATIPIDANTSPMMLTIDNALSRNFTINVAANVSGLPSGSSGGSNVNGTAHASGTAHKSGDWGLPHDEHDALVGELGQEMVVNPRTGQYYTVGDAGPEMVDLPKDAIVFNHIQTKDLLSKGYARGRGKALVTGNAFNGGLTDDNAASSTNQTNWNKTGAASLGNLKKSADDASSAMQSNTGATQGNTNAKQEEQKAVEKSKQTFDWVERRLSYLADKTQEVADAFSEWLSFDKQIDNLQQQFEALGDEILANTSAQSIYAAKAEKIAQSYEYTVSSSQKSSGSNSSSSESGKDDSDSKSSSSGSTTSSSTAQTITISIPEEYKEKVKKGLIAEVEKSIEDMDTSTDEKKALAEAIGEYENYIQKVQDAKTKVRELKQSQVELWEQWANIPAEKASKQVEKLAYSYSHVNATADVASSGMAGIRAALQNVQGSKRALAKADKHTTFGMQNHLIDAQTDQAKKEMDIQKNAEQTTKHNYNIAKDTLAAAKQNAKQLKKQQAAEKSADAEISKYEKALATATKNKNQAGIKAATDSLNKAKSKKTKAQNKQKDIREDIAMNTGDVNQARQQVAIARKAMEDQSQAARDAESAYSQQLVQAEIDKFNNMKNYYEARREEASKTFAVENAQAELANKEDWMSQAEYDVKNSNGYKELIALKDERGALMKQLRDAEAAGLDTDTEEYMELKNQITDLDSEILQNRQNSIELWKTYANAPLEKAEKGLEAIGDQLERINAVSAAAESGGSLLKALDGISTDADIQNLLDQNAGNADYVIQNAMLDVSLGKNKEQVDINKTAVEETQDNLKKAQNALSKLEVGTDQYNEQLQKVTDAEDAAKTARDNLTKSEIELANNTVKNEQQKFNNILEHFEMLYDFNDRLRQNEEGNVDLKNYTARWMQDEQYQTKKDNNNDRIEETIRKRNNLVRSLEMSMADGTIVEGSKEWMQMQTQIDACDSALIDLRRSQLDLFKDWANAPLDKAKAELDDLAKAMDNVNAVMDAFSMGQSGVAALAKFSTDPDIQKLLSMNTGGKSYKGQNAMLKNLLAGDQENVDINREALKTTQETLSEQRAIMKDVTAQYKAGEITEKEYNDQLQKVEIAEEAAEEARKNLTDAEVTLAKNTVEYAKTMFDNTKQWYETQKAYNDAVRKNLQDALDVENYAKEWMQKSQYNQQSANITGEMKDVIEERNALIESLAEQVAEGRIVEGDENWKQMQTEILGLDNAIIQLRNDQLKLYEDWVNVPSEKASKSIEKLQHKYEDLNEVMDAYGSGGSNVAAFIANSSNKAMTDLAKRYQGQPDFMGQNAMLDLMLNNQKSQVATYQNAVNETQDNLQKAMADLQKAQMDAQLKPNDAEAQNTLKDARSKLELAEKAVYDANENLFKSQTDYSAAIVDNEKTKFSNIKSYYDRLISEQRTAYENMEKEYDKSTAHGNYETQAQYNNMIQNRKDAIVMMRREMFALQDQLDKSVASGAIKEGSSEWIEMHDQIVAFNGEILDTETEIEKLTQQQIDLKYDELFERAAHMADLFIDRLETLNNLISEEMMFDKDGMLTAYGALALQNNADMMEENLGNLKRFMRERQMIMDDYAAGKFGEDRFNQLMEENQSSINNAMQAAQSSRQAIMQIIQNQGQAELNAINKVIDARKKALSSKKA